LIKILNLFFDKEEIIFVIEAGYSHVVLNIEFLKILQYMIWLKIFTVANLLYIDSIQVGFDSQNTLILNWKCAFNG